jgi:hypothetical protein
MSECQQMREEVYKYEGLPAIRVDAFNLVKPAPKIPRAGDESPPVDISVDVKFSGDN